MTEETGHPVDLRGGPSGPHVGRPERGVQGETRLGALHRGGAGDAAAIPEGSCACCYHTSSPEGIRTPDLFLERDDALNAVLPRSQYRTKQAQLCGQPKMW